MFAKTCYFLMEGLFPELVCLIGKELNLRSLVQLSSTCTFYRRVLLPQIAKLKHQLFLPAIFKNEDGEEMSFYPGPAVKNRGNLPIRGIYFFYDQHRDESINFFYASEKAFNRSFSPQYVATIDTKVEEVYTHDLGLKRIGHHWNDLNCDFSSLFAFGRSKMIEFWQKY